MTLTPPAVPRLAATIVLVRDDPFEVLLVRRHEKAVFASALVFPGGAVDDDDDCDEWLPLLGSGVELPRNERAIRIAGIREVFEETGVLLASRPDGSDVEQPERATASFLDVVRASGGRLMLDDLHPFAHWITPEVAPRRFDTHFLLARAPKGQQPTPDGAEIVAVEWARPADVVRRAEHKEQPLMFPTLLNLMRLAESEDAASAIAAAQNRQPYTVLAAMEIGDDGSKKVVIPAEAGYGVTEHPFP
ncbi:NUDIX hydrolase [Mycetocola sp. 2940]|uniref:NUDIX hydrolase n=1 Tax=Mycetocola sp. 2940 TaxID=3156452 RepID=UPI0033995D4B